MVLEAECRIRINELTRDRVSTFRTVRAYRIPSLRRTNGGAVTFTVTHLPSAFVEFRFKTGQVEIVSPFVATVPTGRLSRYDNGQHCHQTP